MQILYGRVSCVKVHTASAAEQCWSKRSIDCPQPSRRGNPYNIIYPPSGRRDLMEGRVGTTVYGRPLNYTPASFLNAWGTRGIDNIYTIYIIYYYVCVFRDAYAPNNQALFYKQRLFL